MQRLKAVMQKGKANTRKRKHIMREPKHDMQKHKHVTQKRKHVMREGKTVCFPYKAGRQRGVSNSFGKTTVVQRGFQGSTKLFLIANITMPALLRQPALIRMRLLAVSTERTSIPSLFAISLELSPLQVSRIT